MLFFKLQLFYYLVITTIFKKNFTCGNQSKKYIKFLGVSKSTLRITKDNRNSPVQIESPILAHCSPRATTLSFRTHTHSLDRCIPALEDDQTLGPGGFLLLFFFVFFPNLLRDRCPPVNRLKKTQKQNPKSHQDAENTTEFKSLILFPCQILSSKTSRRDWNQHIFVL